MSNNLRRLLNYLPRTQGGRGDIYIKSSWHKPTPFDQWHSQPPFRPMVHPLRAQYFTRGVRRHRFMRAVLWSTGCSAAIWLLVESVRGLVLL